MTVTEAVLVGWLASSLVMNAYLWRCLRGSYNYAVKAAEHYGAEDVMDGRARAYSDMATVITLDGKAEPVWELGRASCVSDEEKT